MRSDKEKRTVIIFGANHWNTLGAIRSVGKMGIKVVLLLEPCNKSGCSLRFSKYISKVRYLQKLEEAISILQTEYTCAKVKPVIICTSDRAISLLDKHYEELKNRFSFFNIKGVGGGINHYQNKINTFPIAEKYGISLIKTWLVAGKDNLPDNIVFPCLTKGNNSTASSKSDMFVCHDMGELRGCMRDGVEYLVQEYIKRDYEVCIVGFSYNQGKNVYLPAAVRKIRDEMRRQTCYVRLDDISEYPGVNVEGIKKLIEEIGYEGIFSIELICKNGVYYLLELNWRNDACGYLYTAAGANYPYAWCLYNWGVLSDADIRKMKAKTPFYMMSEGDFDNMREGKVGLFAWLKDLMTADGYFQASLRDPLPTIYSLSTKTMRYLIKRLARILGFGFRILSLGALLLKIQ